jgi:hypothetical protein
MGEGSENSPKLPTRVLDVGTLDQPNLHLVESFGGRGKYLALSHCWGAVLHVKTVSANLATHLQNVREENLSRLFQDAVHITRALSSTYLSKIYLWIDALCIVQDDPADWKREAAVMGRVYEDAFLTIAATDGIDGAYSLLDEQHDVFIDDYVVTLPCNSQAQYHGSMFFRPKKDMGIDKSTIDMSPLNRRAWVTQERILSRRILHYTEGMLYWECDYDFRAANGNVVLTWQQAPVRVQLLTVNIGGRITDDSFDDEEPGPITQGTNEFWQMFLRLTHIWSEIIGNYNTCDLTYPKDRLIAIEGLAQSIQDRTGLFYHCGIFFDKEEMVPLQLLWMPSHQGLYYMGQAPSFSWASYYGAVEMWDTNTDVFPKSGWFPRARGEYVATIKELIPPHDSDPEETFNKEGDPTILGAIRMEGRPKLSRRSASRDFDRQNAFADAETIQVPLHGWPRQFDCNERSYAILENTKISPDEPQAFKGWVCFDSESLEPETFISLPVVKTVRFVGKDRSTTGESTTYVVWRILALRRRAGRYGPRDLAFDRVGYGEVFGEHWFDESLPITFTLL